MSWLTWLIIWLQSLLAFAQQAPSIAPSPIATRMPTVSMRATRSPDSAPERVWATGIAKYYSPGVMEQVAHYRGLPIEEHMASVPDCQRIGSHLVALVNGHQATYEIVDCSAPKDRPRHLAEGLILEVDWHSHTLYFPRGEGHTRAQILYWMR